LLSAVAAGLGAKGLEDYLTPAEKWAAEMGTEDDVEQVPDGQARYRQVLDFIHSTQGEVG
jgi:peroxiredoxin